MRKKESYKQKKASLNRSNNRVHVMNSRIVPRGGRRA